MDIPPEMKQYAQDPQRLIDLCRQVIDYLGIEILNPETQSLEAQLGVISQSIDKLEQMKVDVPESLRAEKLRLSAMVESPTGARQLLGRLTEGLKAVLANARVEKVDSNETTAERKKRRQRIIVTPEQIEQIRRLRAEKWPWHKIDSEVFHLSDSKGGKSWSIAQRLGFLHK